MLASPVTNTNKTTGLEQMQVERLLRRYQELTILQSRINTQLTDLALEQQVLLTEQREWLRMLLSRL
jgi:FtsZ-binding cell division protein ZapB